MNFFDVFGEMLVILFAIAVGYLANRLGYLGEGTDQKLSKLLLNITMPCMIVAAVITGAELPELSTILSILEVGLIFYLLELVFVLVVMVHIRELLYIAAAMVPAKIRSKIGIFKKLEKIVKI